MISPEQKEVVRLWADNARKLLVAVCDLVAEDKPDAARSVLAAIVGTAASVSGSLAANGWRSPEIARGIAELEAENARHAEAARRIGDEIARAVADAGPVPT